MRLNSLSMKNFKKYRGAVRVEFQDGLTGILGGNGSGKSTIVEAIAWALYGSRASTVRRDFIKNSRASERDDLEVTLSLQHDGKEMTVLRAMRGKGMAPEARLRIDGELVASGTREVDARLSEILQISFADFMKTFYARQKDLDNLIRDRGSEKREYLLTLLGLDEVRDGALEEIRADLREAEGEVGRVEGALGEIGDVDHLLEEGERAVASAREELLEAKGREEEIATAFEGRRQKLEGVAERRRARDALVGEVARLRADLASKEEAIASDDRRLSEIEEGRWRLFELEPKLTRLRELRLRLEGMEAKRPRYQALLGRRAQVGADLEGRGRLLSDSEARLARLRDESREHEAIRPQEEEYRRLLSELEGMEAKRDRFQELASLAGRERARKEAADENLARVEEEIRGLSAAKLRIAEITPSLEIFRTLQEMVRRQEREGEKDRLLSGLRMRDQAVRSRIERLRAEAGRIEGEVRSLGDLEEREADLVKKGEEIGRLMAGAEEELAGLKFGLEVARRELREAEAQRSRIEALGEESLCPTCERPLAEQRPLLQEKYRAAASGAKERIATLEGMKGDLLARVEEGRRSMERTRRELSQIAELKAERGALLAERRSLLAQGQELSREAEEIEAEIGSIGPVDYDPDRLSLLEAKVSSLLPLVQEEQQLSVRIEALPKKRREEEVAREALATSITRVASLAEEMEALGYSEEERLRARERIGSLREVHRRFSALAERIREIPAVEATADGLRSEVRRLRDELKGVDGEMEALGFDPAEYEGLIGEARSLAGAETAANEIRLALAAEGEVSRHRGEAAAAASRLRGEVARAEEGIVALAFSEEAYREARASLEEASRRLEEARKEASAGMVRLGLAEGNLERLRGEAARRRELEERAAALRRRVQVVETTRVLVNRFLDAILVRMRREIAESAGRILQEVTGKYGRISIDEEFNILVEDEGEFYPISRYSGGEIDMIAVSVRVAISERLMRFSTNGPGYSFLILDEVFGSQDVEHRESMINMLRSLDERFPQIFAISHIGEVQGQFDNSILVVEEEDGSSRIEVEMR